MGFSAALKIVLKPPQEEWRSPALGPGEFKVKQGQSNCDEPSSVLWPGSPGPPGGARGRPPALPGRQGGGRAQTGFLEEGAAKVDPRGGAEGPGRAGRRVGQMEERPLEASWDTAWGWSRKGTGLRGCGVKGDRSFQG